MGKCNGMSKEPPVGCASMEQARYPRDEIQVRENYGSIESDLATLPRTRQRELDCKVAATTLTLVDELQYE